MAEGIYIVERDRNQTAAGGSAVLYGGPYSSEFEAEQKAPEDQDGMEYTVEWLNDYEASRML